MIDEEDSRAGSVPTQLAAKAIRYSNKASFYIVVEIKTAFTRCRHILKTVKNSTDRPPVHTKTAHFLPADFENGRF